MKYRNKMEHDGKKFNTKWNREMEEEKHDESKIDTFVVLKWSNDT